MVKASIVGPILVVERAFETYGDRREGISFSALKSCERWGPGRIQCSKSCLEERARAFAI